MATKTSSPSASLTTRPSKALRVASSVSNKLDLSKYLCQANDISNLGYELRLIKIDLKIGVNFSTALVQMCARVR